MKLSGECEREKNWKVGSRWRLRLCYSRESHFFGVKSSFFPLTKEPRICPNVQFQSPSGSASVKVAKLFIPIPVIHMIRPGFNWKKFSSTVESISISSVSIDDRNWKGLS